jgi:uncharacterized membrane protein YqjE
MATPQMQRSVPEVLQDIVGNLQGIIRAEFRLAKTEITEEAAKAAKPGAMYATGLALGFYGVGFLLLAAVYGLSTVMSGWLAALIVGGVVAIVGAGVVSSSAKKLKRLNLTPEKTMRSLEENVQWAKERIK